MQLMPSVASSLDVNPFNPGQSISGAARLLSSYHEQFGSWPLALAAYNAGPGAVEEYSGHTALPADDGVCELRPDRRRDGRLMPPITPIKTGPGPQAGQNQSVPGSSDAAFAGVMAAMGIPAQSTSAPAQSAGTPKSFPGTDGATSAIGGNPGTPSFSGTRTVDRTTTRMQTAPRRSQYPSAAARARTEQPGRSTGNAHGDASTGRRQHGQRQHGQRQHGQRQHARYGMAARHDSMTASCMTASCMTARAWRPAAWRPAARHGRRHGGQRHGGQCLTASGMTASA